MKVSRHNLIAILLVSLVLITIFIIPTKYNLTCFDDANNNNNYPLFKLKNSVYNFTDIEILTQDSEDSKYPNIAIDGFGNIHLIWQQYNNTNDTDIYYKKWDKSTDTWSTPELVSNISTSYAVDPAVSADKYGNVYVVWDDRTNYLGCGSDNDIFYSKRNSITEKWSLTEVISSYSNNWTYDPTILVDDSGNIHIAFGEHMNYLSSGFDRDIFYTQWSNVSKSWIPIELVSSESDGHSYQPSLAIDESGDVNIVWEDMANYDSSGTDLDIFYKRRSHISGSWSSVEVISTGSNNRSIDSRIVIDKSNNRHIVWSDETIYSGSDTSDYDIFYRRWNNTEGDWTPIGLISTISNETTSNSEHPSIAIDDLGSIHIAWSDNIDYSDSGDDKDIFYRCWDNTIANWTRTELVSKECNSDSSFPSIIVDNLENIHIVWQDNSNYSSSGIDYDVFYKKFINHNAPQVNCISPSIITTNSTGTETIDWMITDDIGEGMYRVIINNSITERNWTSWINESIINMPINRTAPGTFQYTIEYYDVFELYGINDTITVYIDDIAPTINHPNNHQIEKGQLYEIEWTINDDFGGGNYRIFVNDVPEDWHSWTSGAPITYVVDTTAIGTLNITIEYQTFTGQTDYDTVIIQITPTGKEVFFDILPYLIAGLAIISAITSYLIIRNHNKSKKIAIWKEKSHIFSDILNIDLILIIHRETSSTIVQHNFREQNLDADLFSGFLEAMTSFKYEIKKGSYKKKHMEKTLLDYDQYKILIKDGRFIRVAMILDNESSNYLEDSIGEFIEEFEVRYSDILINFTGKITEFQSSMDLINKYFNVSLIYPHCINRKYSSTEISSFQKDIIKYAEKLEKVQGQFYINELISFISSQKPDEIKEKIIANIIDLRKIGLLKLANF